MGNFRNLLVHLYDSVCNRRPLGACTLLRYAIFLATIAFPAQAIANQWDEAIAKAEKRAQNYHDRATALGFPVHAGTMFNELDVSVHACSILGRLLKRESLIKHLEQKYPNQSKDGSDFRYAAISLDNWALTARRLLKLDEPRRIEAWNLDCVGQHGIPAGAQIVSRRSTAFFDRDGNVLRILGDVNGGFAEKLRIALKANRGVDTVALGSGGGSVLEAVSAGRIIRANGLETTLWNNCYSACSLVFLGGTRRTIWSPYPKLGFHKMSTNGVAIPANHPAYAGVAKYAGEMGVEWSVLIKAMLSAEPSSMKYLSHDEMCASRITTWIQRSCF